MDAEQFWKPPWIQARILKQVMMDDEKFILRSDMYISTSDGDETWKLKVGENL